ncbi:MAG TPA: TetR/AcrR family transcriptional regulator [Solirubrobacterales bacterium]|nr:TetR/AcrR family transcriptional regulator [Solirubrobacterales bacterium]
MATGQTETRDGRRAGLVAEATAVLAERGVEATRFSDVAERAGVSVGLLQHYFRSRDALIDAAIEAVAVRKFDRLARAQRDIHDPWELIEAAIEEILASDDPIGDARSWLDVCSAAAQRPNLGAAIERVQQRWVTLIEGAVVAGASRGDLHPAMSPRAVARVVNALIDGMELALASEGGTRADAEAACELTKRAAWRLIGGAGDPPG